MPETRELQVTDEFITRTFKAKPISALIELVWNGLDAGATSVVVEVYTNDLDGPSSIEVRDNGNGMDRARTLPAFEQIGDSWKKQTRKDDLTGRILHGRNGQGRLMAFCLGGQVKWSTRYTKDGQTYAYTIEGHRDRVRKVIIADETISEENKTGTTVEISFLLEPADELLSAKCRTELAKALALYLRQYPRIEVWYRNERIDTSKEEERVENFPQPSLTHNGIEYPVELTLVEWKDSAFERGISLCDAEGFTLQKHDAGIHAKGFTFTGFLKSKLFRDLYQNNDLNLGEMHPVVQGALESARETMRNYFDSRKAEMTRGLLEQWKEEHSYPYREEAKSPVEIVERQVFEICALNVHEHLKEFRDGTPKGRQLTFRLLKEALHSQPEEMDRILEEVLELPPDRKKDLAELLKRTKLSAIISAASTVANRLRFLRGLRLLVFDPDLSKVTKERSELHKMLAHEAWLFDEQFHLSLSDRDLTTVLKRHLSATSHPVTKVEAVKPEGKSRGIIDLFLCNSMASPHRPNEKDYLIVELKAPSVPFGTEELAQLESYAVTIMRDPQFNNVPIRWTFLGISTETKNIDHRVYQPNRPPGWCLDMQEPPQSQAPIGQGTIWVKTWSQIITQAEARLHFFQKELAYDADDSDGLEYLNRLYEKYLPDLAKTK